ncbi:molecular chaperone DnaJ (plasmid) [Pseudomonas sp. CFA]|nr:molecular chaperone DnaJ [Pseudomonas sp. CFA]
MPITKKITPFARRGRMEVKSNLYPCSHCDRTGTCNRAVEGASCAACVNASELKGIHVGLPCGTCGGIGHAEPLTERYNKRLPLFMGLAVVFSLLLGVFWGAVTESRYFTELLAFSGPLIGVVLAYYFSARNSR